MPLPVFSGGNINTGTMSDEIISLEALNTLRRKKAIIEAANKNTLILTNENWAFISHNKVAEVFTYIANKYYETITPGAPLLPSAISEFEEMFLIYIDSLDNDNKIDLLYGQLRIISDELHLLKTVELIEKLNLFDGEKCLELLHENNFSLQKIALKITTCDKLQYGPADVALMEDIIDSIKNIFKPRGAEANKKPMLSSKEKPVWICECGNENDIGKKYCKKCLQDMYGFKEAETKPSDAIHCLSEKVSLLKELLSERLSTM